VRKVFFLFLLAIAGCGSQQPARQPDNAEPPKQVLDTEDQGTGNRPMQVDLDDADAREMLAAVEHATGKPVLVHASAIHALSCVTITMHIKEQISANEWAERVWKELRSKGFVIKPGPNGKGFEVSHDDHQEGSVDPCPKPKDDHVASAGVVDEAKVEAEIRAGIKTVSPTERTMTLHARDLFLEHNALLMKQARIVPEQSGGKVVGVRLFGIRSNSLLGELGFENGDRLDTINGKSVATPEQALEAYAGLQKAKTIDIGIVRRGQNMKLTIRFID
jgi:hypothetical protein